MKISEKNYDFRFRHWECHHPGMRDPQRKAADGEVELTTEWSLGCAADAPEILLNALKDFQDYLLVSMGLSLPVVRVRGEKVLWFQYDPERKKGFALDVSPGKITVSAAKGSFFRAVVHLEDLMNLELAPVLPKGCIERKPLYQYRAVHSGCGIDEFPDSELAATVHAGYDVIVLFLKDFDRSAVGYCNVNDLIQRAARYELGILVYNYIQSYVHPDDPEARKTFDSVYGELFRRYPNLVGISLAGESLEFPSKDPATTGKRWQESFIDGIPDTRPSPGWYPCCDYPAYLEGIEQAVHRVNPRADVIFETYNWGYAPYEERKRFLEHCPKKLMLSVCYEIFARKTLEGLQTPVMDYTISTREPGYYFTSECETAHQYGISLQANTNTAGIGWDFGAVPYVPVPYRWLERDRDLRVKSQAWGILSHYATHHYGWWNSVAADLGKWSSWEDFEPDYDLLLKKIAVRDYGRKAADNVLKAWQYWGDAMDYYTASNEDQYGPWRVGPAYPFIFHPDITRTLGSKEIQFPTASYAHFGWKIIKTFYHPYENDSQSPGFLRYPAELRSLEKMLELWERGLSLVQAAEDSANGARLIALGQYIRNSIRTTIHIKQWWQLNMRLQTASGKEEALKILDELEALAREEIGNARDTIPAVETDSRLGWEPSMEYVCDRWHLEWKIRQVESALREIAVFRKILCF